MSDPVTVFINERPVRAAAGSSAADAVALLDPALAGSLLRGGAYLTDARGIRVEPGAPVYSGAIFRVVQSARAAPDEADAHA